MTDDTGDKKYSGDNFRGSDNASPYPVSRLGAPVSLVDSARIIEAAFRVLEVIQMTHA